MTKEVNCMNCMIGRFKEDLCDEKMCEALKGIGKSEDFVDIIMLAKEIVRCEDCRFLNKAEIDNKPYYFCRNYRQGYMHSVDLNGYCSWGERRE